MSGIDPRQAWQRYRPSDDNPWDLKKVGHLYRRAAFGASMQELQRALEAGPDRTIGELLEGRADPDGDAVWTALSRTIGDGNDGNQMTAAWLHRMLHSTQPVRDKMTLFWHNHFATSNAKVNNTGYMLGQYELMRRHALGSFRTLLVEISHDPAMMVWLDTIESRRGQPNENYARELMELFSLGINHPTRQDQRNYTERDIREAARAFTGWAIENGRAVFRANQHDDTEKNVLGQRGRWQSRDIVRICLEQEAAPYFICRKLFRFLVSETMTPTAELLAPLARQFRESDYDFGRLVETVLRSNLFFSTEAHRSKVKTPVDFALGVVRALEGHTPGGDRRRRVGASQLASALDGLGQRLFYPPSVAGWEGGRAWLNGQTFLLRQNLALALTSTTDDRFGRRTDPAELLRRHNVRGNPEQVDFFLRLFLQGETAAATRHRLIQYLEDASSQSYPFFWTAQDAADHRSRALCHMVLCLPEFQLD
ncbi:MAG: DUF1800 domain-containing protein [Gemmataceae bacterium]|nr:DUF1800 domain-containing protein [Gemmataceae bacterium]MCI0738327.1 DUF1800 domain-containing protein [Gemmataceae bacterium]